MEEQSGGFRDHHIYKILDNEYNMSDEEENVEKYDFNKLPEHACDYCGIHSPESVVKCCEKGCGKWFCNSKAQGLASHIVLHLVRAKHNEIKLHPRSIMGGITLECFFCQNRNIFNLGIVQLEDSDNCEEFILVCRQLQCAKAENLSKYSLKKENWRPIIEEKQILLSVVSEPSDDEVKRSRDITIEMINKLEALRKTNPEATIRQVEVNQMSEPLPHVSLKYESGENYFSVFSRLIDRESLIDKTEKEKQIQKDVEVQWEISLKKKWLAKFSFPSSEEYGTNWFIGNEMKLSCTLPNGNLFTTRGHAVRFTSDDKIVLEISAKDPPTDITRGYTIEFVWKSTTYSRMKEGLKRFWRNPDSISKYLYERILGKDPKMPEKQYGSSSHTDLIECTKLPQLNQYQLQAVREALRNPLTLIQGPPGTGKTITSSSIVFQLAQMNKHAKLKNHKIMVCAPSNIVVDHLAETINKTGVKVVRLCSKSREIISSEAEPLTLHYQVRSLELRNYATLKKLQGILDEHGELTKEDEAQYKKLYTSAEKLILDNAEIICCTCSSSFDPRLNNYTFSQVLVDEATQAVEPECLLPLLKGAKKVILVGDHMQLGPVVVCREVANAGLKISLFERLVKINVKPVMLQIQYRMHPELSAFSSNAFYDGGLQNGISANDRAIKTSFSWPNPSKPILFWHVRGSEEMSASGTSYLNRYEAEKINNLLSEMAEGGVSLSKIAIITPYKGQRGYLTQTLLRAGSLKQPLYKDLEIASIDSFQGREKDYIIISTVRSSEGQGIGFMKDERRLNVALTRARYGMIIVGNASVLAKDRFWSSLLFHFKENGCLFEGMNWKQLSPSNLVFTNPELDFGERARFVQDVEDTLTNMNQGAIGLHPSYSNQQLISHFSNKHRNSTLGFEMLPEQRTLLDSTQYGHFGLAPGMPFFMPPTRSLLDSLQSEPRGFAHMPIPQAYAMPVNQVYPQNPTGKYTLFDQRSTNQASSSTTAQKDVLFGVHLDLGDLST